MWLIVVVSLLVLAACGPDVDDPAGGAATTSTSTATSTTAPVETCSAAGLGPALPQDGLPGPVATTRNAIVVAASACDFEALDAVGDPRVSFGAGTDAAAFWRAEENAGNDPLRYLVELLSRTYAVTADGTYVWPAAFARPSWDAVTAQERQALRGLYDDEDFRQFAQFGSYIGWRVGIQADGTWRFFVAGD